MICELVYIFLLVCQTSNMNYVSFFGIFSAKLGGECSTTEDCEAVIGNSDCNGGVCECADTYVAASDNESCIKG